MKIVVRGANWIGDAVMTIPAMKRLRTAMPGAHITLHTRKWAEGVFRGAEFLDDIVTIERDASRSGSIRRQAERLRRERFELAVLFPNSFEAALIARLAKIPRIAGYRTQGRGILLTDRIAVPSWKDSEHESRYYLNLVEQIDEGGPTEGPLDASLAVSSESRQAASRLLQREGLDLTKPLVGFGAGSTNSLAKRWPAASFAALADILTERSDAEIVLMGAASEADTGDEIALSAKVKPFNLVGRTDLTIAAAVLAELDLFVSNDMGLAHLAAAVGTPTAVIFGPTRDVSTRPLGDNVVVIRETVECSPCMLRECPIDHRCMTRITPERVYAAVSELKGSRIHK